MNKNTLKNSINTNLSPNLLYFKSWPDIPFVFQVDSGKIWIRTHDEYIHMIK